MVNYPDKIKVTVGSIIELIHWLEVNKSLFWDTGIISPSTVSALRQYPAWGIVLGGSLKLQIIITKQAKHKNII